MIFVTVGAQMPFDRLVQAVDGWAAAAKRDVFAQIGPSNYQPRNIRWTTFLSPAEFRHRVAQSATVVAHAGMGSIITALEIGKPILVMPRRGNLFETRNDHQLATARRFLEQGRIAVAFDENELLQKLNQLDQLTAAERISSSADPRLIATIAAFVRGEPMASPAQAASVAAPR